MIKLNIQLFGGDTNPDDFKRSDKLNVGDTFDLSYRGKTYSGIPTSILETLGASNPFGREAVATAALVTYLYKKEFGLDNIEYNVTNAQRIYNWYEANKKHIKLDGSTVMFDKWLKPNQSGNEAGYGHILDALEDGEFEDFYTAFESSLAKGDIAYEEYEYNTQPPLPLPPDSEDPEDPDAPDPGGEDIDPTDPVAERQYLFDKYYNELFSMDKGTLGARTVGNNQRLIEQTAQGNMMAADAGIQNQAINQAQAVKQITDALRSERMARLRAGLNESQIADQDLQMLLSNTQALTQQATAANQARLEAQLMGATARETAMAEYLGDASTQGATVAAMDATEAGSITDQAANYLRSMYPQYANDLTKIPNYKKLLEEATLMLSTGNKKGNTTPS